MMLAGVERRPLGASMPKGLLRALGYSRGYAGAMLAGGRMS